MRPSPQDRCVPESWICQTNGTSNFSWISVAHTHRFVATLRPVTCQAGCLPYDAGDGKSPKT